MKVVNTAITVAVLLFVAAVFGLSVQVLAQTATGNGAASGCGSNTQACGNAGGVAIVGNGGSTCTQGNGKNNAAGCATAPAKMSPVYSYAQSTTACGGNYDGFDSTAAQDAFWGVELCGGDADQATMFTKCPTNGNCHVFLYISPPELDCTVSYQTAEFTHFFGSPGTGDVDFEHTGSPFTTANRVATSGGSCNPSTGGAGGSNQMFVNEAQPDVYNYEVSTFVNGASWLNGSTWQGLFYDNQSIIFPSQVLGASSFEDSSVPTWRGHIGTHASGVGAYAILNAGGPGAGSYSHNNGTGSGAGIINWAVDVTDICDNLDANAKTHVRGILFEKSIGNTATVTIGGTPTASDYIWPSNTKTLINTASHHWHDNNCNNVALMNSGMTGKSGTTSWVQRAYAVVLRGLMTRNGFDGAQTTANIVDGPDFPQDIQNQNTEQTVFPENELNMTQPYVSVGNWVCNSGTGGSCASNSDTLGGGCNSDTGGTVDVAQLCGSVGTGPDGGTAAVYVREFAACYKVGVSIGPCAVVANMSQTVNITISQLTLNNNYDQELTPTGGPIFDDPVTTGHHLCANSTVCNGAWAVTSVTGATTIPHCTIKNPGSNQAVIDAMDATNGCFVVLLDGHPLNQETYQGLNVFDANNAYTTDISGTSVDPNSAAVIANQGGLALDSTAGFSGGIPIQTFNLATNSTTTWTPTVAGSHNPPVEISGMPLGRTAAPVPWATSGFAYESCCSDHHGNVINTDSHFDYEMYNVTPPGTSLAVGAGIRWDLSSALSSQYQTDRGDATASDEPMIAGSLISDRDCCGVTINHALAFLYPTNTSGAHTSSWGYVRPASGPVFGSAGNCGVSVNTDCTSTSIYYGDRLRLHSSFTLTCITNGTCPQTASIVAALKKYGMYYEDQASSFGLRFFANHNTISTSSWSTTDLANLNNIHITDFDIVQRGTIICESGHSPC